MAASCTSSSMPESCSQRLAQRPRNVHSITPNTMRGATSQVTAASYPATVASLPNGQEKLLHAEVVPSACAESTSAPEFSHSCATSVSLRGFNMQRHYFPVCCCTIILNIQTQQEWHHYAIFMFAFLQVFLSFSFHVLYCPSIFSSFSWGRGRQTEQLRLQFWPLNHA